MIGSEDFDYLPRSIAKADEVFDNIQKTVFRHHAIKHGFPCGRCGFGIISVNRFPSDEAVFVGCNRAHSRLCHIAHHAKGVGHKKTRDVLHVVAKLKIRLRGIRLFARWTLKFEYDKGYSVDERNDIRTLFRVFDVCPLIYYVEVVVLRIAVINEVNDVVTFLFAIKITNLNAILKVIHEGFVSVLKRIALDIRDLQYGFLNRGLWHTLVDARKCSWQDIRKKNVIVFIAGSTNVRTMKICIAKLVS